MQCTSWWGSFFFDHLFWFVINLQHLDHFQKMFMYMNSEHHDLGSLYPIHYPSKLFKRCSYVHDMNTTTLVSLYPIPLSFKTGQKTFISTWTPWPWLVYIQSIYPSKLFKICSHSKDVHVYMNTMTLASLYPIHLSFKPIQKMFIAMHDVKEIGFLETLMGMS